MGGAHASGMRFALATLTLPVLALFVACSGGNSSGPQPTPTEATSREIGPSGGLIVLPDGSSVSIPEGALTHDVRISIATDPNAPSAAALGTPVGQTYLLGPEGQQFLKPVTVTLAIAPDEIPPGETENDVVVYTAPQTSAAYTPLATSFADSLHVTTTTTHFSHFVPLISAVGNPEHITIGFSGDLAQFGYYPDFFATQSSLAPSAPTERLCHIYLPWNIACPGSDASCKSSATPVSVTTPSAENWDTLCGHYAAKPNNNDPQYVACWLFAAEQGFEATKSRTCDEALVSFKAKGLEREADIHYENAMRAFFAAFDASHTGYKGGFAFTPWNEPDNPASAGNGLCTCEGKDCCKEGKTARAIGPDEAAKYYLTAEHLCETVGGGCKVAAGDFASNGQLWKDYEESGPGHYLRSYKSYIEEHASDAAYKLKSTYPKYFAFHGWHDINLFLDHGDRCDDASTCMTVQMVRALSDKGWASAELWDTEVGVNQQGPRAFDSGRQSCGAAFLLHLTALDKRIKRLYVMRLSPAGSGEFPQALETGHEGSPALDVLASHSNYFAPGCWKGENYGATVKYVETDPEPPKGYYNVYETTPVGGIAPVIGSPGIFVPVSACAVSGADAEHSLRPGGSSSKVTICIDDEYTYQSVVGFGAAMTDSAAYDIVYNLSGGGKDVSARLKGNQQQALLHALFNDTGSGIGLRVLRQPIGASDFTHNKTPYALVKKDKKESAFSIAHDKAYIIPALKAALDINHDIQIVGSPWSAPAWMKANDSMIDSKKGSLKSGKPKGYSSYEEYYADYLVSAIKGYGGEGVHIDYLTPLNEPGNGAGYPGMHLTEDQEEAVITAIHDRATKDKLTDLKILGYDNNWETKSEKENASEPDPVNLFNKFHTGGALAGIAFHCYGGNPTAMDALFHPDFHNWVTECTSAWNDEKGLNHEPVHHGHGEAIEQLIRSMRHSSETFLTWNLALGPDLENPRDKREHEGTGCNNCIGVARIEDGTWKPERDFAEIGHASTFVKPGAQVVYSDSYEDYLGYTGSPPSSGGGIETVAFVNPDKSHVLVVYNSSESEKTIDVRWESAQAAGGGSGFQYVVPKRSALTFTWAAANPSPPPPPPPPADGGVCGAPSSGCHKNFSATVCDYNWSNFTGFTCADNPGYSAGTCSSDGLTGCCITTVESPSMDGTVTTTSAVCYYDADPTAAKSSCTGTGTAWSTCLP
jgi:glucosylceramidase